MQKRKLFIVLMAILTISLIGLSAQCGLVGEAPTIKIEIYDGPDYSEDDEMCYYRLETTKDGFPLPEVTFDDDDNVKPLGSGRVEVGVGAGDTYTLTATATNKSGTAAVSIVLSGECGDTAADADPGDDADADGDDADGDGDDDADGDADADADADADVPGEVPTISLAVYQGPTLEGSICYTRVEATVTGSPNPVISFSKDDSSGSFGSKKAQVNIDNPGDTYILTATATNSEGSATDTIAIDWSCPIPEPDPIVTNVDINLDQSISGYIIVEFSVHENPPVYTYVGDYLNDRQIKAFLSFNINSISSLSDVTITDASITMPVDGIEEQPETMPEVHVKTFDFGNSLTIADQGAGGSMIKTFPTSSSMTSFNFSGSGLESALQNAMDSHSQRFQLKISLSGINADGVGDWYRFRNNNISLHIQYEVPG